MKKLVCIYCIVITSLVIASIFPVKAQSGSYQRPNAYSNEFYKNWILENKKHPLIVYSELDTFTITKQGNQFIVLKNESIVFYIKNNTLVNPKGEIKISKRENSIITKEYEYQIVNEKDNLFIKNQDNKDVVAVYLKKKGNTNYFDIEMGYLTSTELLIFSTFLKYALDVKRDSDWLYGLIGTL